MPDPSKRRIARVRKSERGQLEAIAGDQIIQIESPAEPEPPPQPENPKPPISFYLMRRGVEIASVKTDHKGAESAVAKAIAENAGADTVEVAVGEPGEPKPMQAKRTIEAAFARRLDVNLRLPR